MDPAESKIRFGCIFPNLIPVLSPSDLTYIRVDPVAHDRLRLYVRSYDNGEGDAALREFRRVSFQHTMNQDISIVQRTQRGLHADRLPAGVHASVLEARIGHLERMWAMAMAAEVHCRGGYRTAARSGCSPWRPERVTCTRSPGPCRPARPDSRRPCPRHRARARRSGHRHSCPSPPA